MKLSLPRCAVISVVAVLGVSLAACGSGGSSGGSGKVEVTDAWARTSAMSQSTGAVYMTITSPTDDAVVSASVDASVAADAQLHETMMEMSATTVAGEMGGSMMMHEVDEVPLPGGRAVAFKPGGYHIMLTDLVSPLVAGNSVKVTLTLESGATVTFDAEVREDAP